MEVNFTNIPVAFNYMFQANGAGEIVSQSVVPGTFESLNTMSYNNPGFRNDRSFVMNIANWSDSNSLPASSSIDELIVMKPGETLVCGPTLPPGSSFDQDTKIGIDATGFDWRNTNTKSIKAMPFFTPGLGYEIYAVTISHIRASLLGPGSRLIPGRNYYPGQWQGHPFMMLRDISAGANPKKNQSTVTDKFYLKYKIQRPEWYKSDANGDMESPPASFEVTAKLQSTASSPYVDYADLQFDYGNSDSLIYNSSTKPFAIESANDNLNKVFNNRVYRYPPSDSLTGFEIAAPAGVTYSNQSSYVHPFAIFSAYTRTSSGGVYETGSRIKGGG